MVASLKPRRIAIEITAAGIEVEKVRPALRPKYTLAAVKTNVMMIPMISPRPVSSLRMFAVIFADRRERRIVWNRRQGQDDIALAELKPPHGRSRRQYFKNHVDRRDARQRNHHQNWQQIADKRQPALTWAS